MPVICYARSFCLKYWLIAKYQLFRLEMQNLQIKLNKNLLLLSLQKDSRVIFVS